MNYLSHGCPFLDRPNVLAGTALPDLCRRLGPGARLDLSRGVPPAEARSRAVAEVLEGVGHHVRSDRRFHLDPVFEGLVRDLAADLRARQQTALRRWRSSFLAHVAIEVLLDAILLEEVPDLGVRYHQALDLADWTAVTTVAGWLSRQGEPDGLQAEILRFRSGRPLMRPLDAERIVTILRAIGRRLRAAEPVALKDWVEAAREPVRRASRALLPEEVWAALPSLPRR